MYIEIISKDITRPGQYLIPSLLFSTALVILVSCLCAKKNIMVCNKYKRIFWIFFLSYILIIFQTAFLSREPGSRKSISLTLFETWGNGIHNHAFFIENIIMFVPFGILTPILFFKMRKVQCCVLSGFLCSCTIEIMQLLTQRGYCQVDDVLTNTVGAFLGWLIWKTANRLIKIRR